MSTTQDTYNLIAPSWYNYRHRSRFQSELVQLAQRWQKGKLLNVGCAHGADFVPFATGFELHGVDYSTKMLELAQKYAAKNKFNVILKEADARCLPYADDSFDYSISLAVIHHIEDSEGRIQALKELYRVLKPGGEAFITIWNRWEPKHWFKKKNLLHPWKSKEKTLYRYYYLFSFHEIERLARKAGFE